MEVPACAVGRIEPDGAWIGFAPTVDDGYALTLATPDATYRRAATVADLAALAVVWFEEALPPPPESLSATVGDIAAIVRHAADRVTDPARRHDYAIAVDAIDDGLAADAVLDRLTRALGEDVDPVTHLRARADAMRRPG